VKNIAMNSANDFGLQIGVDVSTIANIYSNLLIVVLSL